MEKTTDWLTLWRQLVEVQNARHRARAGPGPSDVWHGRAADYDAAVERRWTEPDSSRRLVAADLVRWPGCSVVDIGAGTGSWTAMLAQEATHVTAIDPSPAMLDRLRRRVTEEGLSNVTVVEGAWLDVEVGPHDLAFCSHAMYGSPDLARFVRRMEAVAERRCYLLIRALLPDSVMAEAAAHVWRQPYDSPCFQVAYGALLQLGILANVLMEEGGPWEPWAHESIAAALGEVKRRLALRENSEHDGFLRDLLARRLTRVGDRYVWPVGVRSALIYWDPADSTNRIPT
jgi:SAM-dependent methyltransferase